jgi:hypothetical protein
MTEYIGTKRINRRKGQSNIEFFYFLSNKLGYSELCICHNYYSNGMKGFSKWMNFLDLLKYEPEEYIKEVFCTREEFINKATHRSVLDIELMIDIDEPGNHKSIKEKGMDLCNRLEKLGIFFTCHFSGSKSYHISILVPKLKNKSKAYILNYKQRILSQLISSDGQKASSRNMIALEGVPHWKTGKIKTEVLSFE